MQGTAVCGNLKHFVGGSTYRKDSNEHGLNLLEDILKENVCISFESSNYERAEGLF